MTERGRHLLRSLVGKGRVRAEELGLSQGDLAAAVADLGAIVDDDNRQVTVVKTYRADDRITAIELTGPGRGLASHV